MKKIQLALLITVLLLIGATLYYKLSSNFNSIKIPKSFKAKVFDARHYVLLFKYEKAQKLYALALKQNPEQKLREEYLAFLVSRENLAKAHKVADELIKQKPHHFLANLVNVVFFIGKDKLSQAVSSLKHSLGKSASFNTDIYAILASLQYYQKDQKKQFNYIASQIKQQMPSMYYNQKLLFAMNIRDFPASEAAAKVAVDKYPSIENITIYSKLLYRHNKNLGISTFKKYLNDTFLTDKVVGKYLLASNTFVEFNNNQVLSHMLMELAPYFATSSNLAYVEPDKELILHIISMLDKLPMAAIELGTYYAGQGNYNLAIKNFNSVDHSSFYYRLIYDQVVDYLKSLDKTKQAEQLLISFAKFDDTNPQPYLELGGIYKKNNKYARAIASYSKALNIGEANNQSKAIWLAHYFRGITYNNMHDWPKAQDDLLAALKINDKDPLLLNYIGYSFLLKGYNLKRGFKLISKSVKMAPNNPNILDSYSYMLLLKKDYTAALNAGLRAKKALPFDPEVNYHLGEIYFMMGNKIKARMYWISALNMNPSRDLRKKLSARVEG